MSLYFRFAGNLLAMSSGELVCLAFERRLENSVTLFSKYLQCCYTSALQGTLWRSRVASCCA